jgi:hypothetical protein
MIIPRQVRLKMRTLSVLANAILKLRKVFEMKITKRQFTLDLIEY